MVGSRRIGVWFSGRCFFLGRYLTRTLGLLRVGGGCQGSLEINRERERSDLLLLEGRGGGGMEMC